jgi:ABC-type oligopeptide transport system substrate-binding subunit/class 3 adenylate cyclase
VDAALRRLIPTEYAERLLATRGRVTHERRLVTMLFADVKGSTAMAEQLDPEDVLEVMNGAFEVLIGPVVRYDGTLARLMGDAVLAFFGAPLAHEDDAERAVRAGLEMVVGARAYGERLAEERGIEGFAVRVGIHTGEVVVGEVGTDLRVEYTAMGDAVNVAARMEQAAAPGTVLVTADTHRLVEELFEVAAVGPLALKGKAEPVAAYRVVAARPGVEKARGVPGLVSPLVGREGELGALAEAVERVRAGVGGVVTVVGEAGLGKSRLVAEVQSENLGKVCEPVRIGPSQGLVRWVEGRCLSYGTSIAYLLWIDVLRGILAVTVEDAPEAVAERLADRVRALCPERYDAIYPYLASLLSLPLDAGGEQAIADLDGEQRKARTFGAIETLLGCTAGEGPLVVVCEDLHWADPTSLELLEGMLRLTDEAALLLILVFRPEREHGSWRVREEAARDYPHRLTDLRLRPLTEAESGTLVANLLTGVGLPEGLQARLLAVSEGNPFYVEEVLRSLIDQGVIVVDEARGTWVVRGDAADLALPQTLQGVLAARIDRLAEETKRVLQMAAVVGRIFLYRVLAAVAAEERRLDARLLALQREEMIRERARIPEREYIFKHELTREVAYSGLLKRERRDFHRQVAEALERLYPERVEEQAGLLAHHWERAGEALPAIAYLQRAGDQARLLYAPAEAVDYYRRALALLEAQGELEQAARTWMKLGLTHHNAFDFEAARQAYDDGFMLWQRAVQAQPVTLPAPPHALRTVWFYDPVTLDACRAIETISLITSELLFSGLVELTPEMSVVPDVACSWEVSDGGRRYVFHLRDDVRWSDGRPVSAHDFEFAWKRMLAPATDSPNANLLYDLRGAQAFHQGELTDPDQVGVSALDALTLQVELRAPASYFVSLLTDPRMYPVPRHVVQERPDTWAEPGHIVTNGPFLLQAWQQGVSLHLARRPHYHGRFAGNVQQIELIVIGNSDAPTQLELYGDDRLDILDITYYAPEDLRRARQRYAADWVSVPAPCTYYQAFVASQLPFDDVRVRRAFVMAIDREACMQALTSGAEMPATGGFVPPGMPGHTPAIALPYDPDEARRLLTEAGYPGGRGFPTALALTMPEGEPTVRDLQARWQRILGVDTEIEVVKLWDYDRILREKPAHMFLNAWVADYPDPDNFLRVGMRLFSAGWQHEEYDRLVAQAGQVSAQGARMTLYREADRILVEQAAILPLGYQRRLLLVKPWVTNHPVVGRHGSYLENVVIVPH